MNQRRMVSTFIVSCMMLLMLSGCLYPNEQRSDRQISPEESILLVQSAVDRFQAERTLLPIKNFDMSTPLYERYQIDFSQLIKLQYLSAIPAQAFESGGSSIFVLVHAEDDPTVKMMDIVTIQKAGEMQEAVREFMQKNSGNLPAGDTVQNGWHRLDLEAIRKEKKQLKSVFSGQDVTWLVNDDGQVVVDYSMDLMMLIDRERLADELTPELDLRSILIDHAYFVPVKSMPYHWDGHAPVIAAQ